MKEAKTIYKYLFYSLVLTIPLEHYIRAVPNILIGILSVLFFVVVEKSDFKKLKQPFYKLTLGFILFLVLRSFLSGTLTQDLYLIKKPPILLGMLLLALPIRDKKGFLFSYLISIAIANVISLGNLGISIYQDGNFDFSTGQRINQVLVLERLYFGLANSISVAFSLVALKYTSGKIKTLIIASILLSTVAVFIVVSRAAIIIILLILMIKLLERFKLKRALLIGGGALILIVSFFFFNSNLSKRFLHAGKQNDFFHKVRAWEPRYVIWNCAYLIATDSNNNLLIGDGFYNTQNNLDACYLDIIKKDNKRKWFLETSFNTHNQYLDFLLSTGIIGLLFFLLLLFSYFRNIKGNLDLLNVFLVIVVFGLIENFLHRQIGVYLSSLIFVLLSIKGTDDNFINE